MVFQIIFFILALANLNFSQETQTIVDADYKKGMKETRLSEKIHYFEKALANNPTYTDALYQLGICYFRSGNYQKSIVNLERINELDIKNYPDLKFYQRNAYALLAKELIDQSKFDAAFTAVQHALQIDGAYPPALTLAGILQYNSGDNEAAMKSLKQSLALNAKQESAWDKLGDVYFRLESYVEAIAAYEKALQLNPKLQDAKFHMDLARKRNTPELWLRKYEAAVAGNRLESGLKILQQAKAIFPESQEISQRLEKAPRENNYAGALLAIKNHQWREAQALLQSIDPEYEDTKLKLEEVPAEIMLAEQKSAKNSPQKTKPKKSIQTKQKPRVAAINKRPADKSTLSQKNAIKLTPPPDSAGVLANKPSIIKKPDSSHTKTDASAEFVRNKPPATAVKTEVRSENGAYFSAAVVAVLACTALGFLFFHKKNKIAFFRKTINNHLTATLKESELKYTTETISANSRTDDLIKLASETPITFDRIDTNETLTGINAKEDNSTFVSARHKSIHQLETRTLQGGLRKAQKIGRYVIEEEVGRGSMGLVFKAWDPKLDRTVVVKQVVFNTSNNDEISRLRDRLFREARAAGKLNHPNIVIIYDVEEENQYSYIVMEYVAGQDLKSVLDKDVKIEIKRALKLTSEMCMALDFAHQNGIIHRDIKPSNILISHKDKVKIADFGIAKLPQFDTLTQTGDIVGTPYYMSPEQIEGGNIDGRSDIFSTGVVLYEMLTGVRPFQGDNIPAIIYKIVHKTPKASSRKNKELPEIIDVILNKALAKEPGQRFQTASEFNNALETIQKELA